jgi:predicted phage tail protein
VALSFVSFGSSTVFAGIAAKGATLAWGSKALFLIGGAMLFQGVSELIAPTPRMPGVSSIGGAVTNAENAEQRKSALFDKSNANSVQGSVVPVLYGERLIASLPILSFGIEIQNSI